MFLFFFLNECSQPQVGADSRGTNIEIKFNYLFIYLNLLHVNLLGIYICYLIFMFNTGKGLI
jgi:hypothetical protein